jgi:tetratricopeptide (TPR) repeat protein
VLFQTGLLTRDAGNTVRVHRLLQAVTLAHLPQVDRRQRIIDAANLLVELFPYDGWEPPQWPRCAQLLAHAQAVLHHVRALNLTSPTIARLLTATGIYLAARRLGARRARELHEQALAMRQRLYDGDHPELARALTNLANDLHELGQHERARELDEQALAMYQRLYHGDHPHMVTSLSNLGADLRALGEHEGARELDEQARRQRLAERRPGQVLTRRNKDISIDRSPRASNWVDGSPPVHAQGTTATGPSAPGGQAWDL